MQRALKFNMNYHLVHLYQVYEMLPGSKMVPPFVHMFYTCLFRQSIKNLLTQTARHSLFVCFVALRPKSTAMVMAGQSVHLTTLFPGQA